MKIDKIVIATSNKGKAAEFARMLKGLDIQILSLADFDDVSDVEENGSTFAENAFIKASTYAKELNCYAIADDSGLQVDALDLAPGIYSARYAGDDSPDRDLANNSKLLKELAEVPQEQRRARFCCSLCLADPDGNAVICTEGFVKGEIIDNPRGDKGFGYDPLFYIKEYDKTAAELEPDIKNKISHRGQAIKLLLEQLQNHINF
ncbi:MAG: XTP/dITP diphosphatase [Phycisphaerae bacterium]|nr:XTP/dITP diphosphatase [Phycisphaerae bacterium]